MAKTYNIANKVIFAMNEDGSVTRLGEIDANDRIVGIQEKVRVVKETDDSSSFFMWVAIIAAVILGYLYFTTKDEYSQATSEISKLNNTIQQQNADIASLQSNNTSLQNQIGNLRHEKSQVEQNLQTLRSKVGSSYPLIISDIQVANTYSNGAIETDYGNTLYSSRTMYLTPKIIYEGISSGNITLHIKLYRPNGQLSTGTSSPSGYSYTSSTWVYSGNNSSSLGGWGNSTKGNWPSGNYRFEIWYNNTCLKSKTFTVY